MTKRSKKNPFFASRYRNATARVAMRSPLRPSSLAVAAGDEEWPQRLAILSWSHMFQTWRASVMQRRTVTVMANQPSTKRHTYVSLTERAQKKSGSTNRPVAQTSRNTLFHSCTHLALGSKTCPIHHPHRPEDDLHLPLARPKHEPQPTPVPSPRSTISQSSCSRSLRDSPSTSSSSQSSVSSPSSSEQYLT